MTKELLNYLKCIDALYDLRNKGCKLTQEALDKIKQYEKISDISPKEFILDNNTLDIKPSDIIEFLT